MAGEASFDLQGRRGRLDLQALAELLKVDEGCRTRSPIGFVICDHRSQQLQVRLKRRVCANPFGRRSRQRVREIEFLSSERVLHAIVYSREEGLIVIALARSGERRVERGLPLTPRCARLQLPKRGQRAGDCLPSAIG